MKIDLRNYEPTERTFAGCETPQDLRELSQLISEDLRDVSEQ